MNALPSVSQLESGSQGGLFHEAPVFIVCREPFGLSALTLEDAQPHTLPAGHKAQWAFSFKVDPHLSSLSEDDIAKLRFAEAQNVHA